ncbi:hypothetical protein Hanom_Chr00s005412g01728881 [Helianthus anomalus]
MLTEVQLMTRVVVGRTNGGCRRALNRLFTGHVSVPRARACPLSLANLFFEYCSQC